MEIKNYQLYDIVIAAKEMAKYGNAGFRIKMLVVEGLANERINKINQLKDPSIEYKEFQQNYQDLVSKYCELDDNGGILLYENEDGTGRKVSDGHGYPNIVDNPDEYIKAKDALYEEYSDEIKEYNELHKSWMNALQEDVDPVIEFPKIDESAFPDEIKDDKYDIYLRILMPIIKME